MIKKLLLTIVLSYTIVTIKAQQIDTLTGPTGSKQFGNAITVLPNGNYVVADPTFNDGAILAVGAVYLYNGANHSLISSLKGSNANDRVGNGGITALSNGNYVVRSPSWNGNRGAATWGNGSTGISGTVSSSNSLVGSNANDYVGGSITVLSNGNYIVRSSNWNNSRGAATWGNGSTGISGTVSSSNSLVGSNANGFDYIGNSIIALSNGNYVVSSTSWNGNRGAATWGNGSTGISGTVSSSNSLVGSNVDDYIGNYGITVLSNGNYVVSSSSWNGNRGAATWGNGSTGISGTVSSSNSLVGSNANDYLGSGITILNNGNYVVRSSSWNGNRGAATWGNGSTGISGTVSSSNSLVGSNANDYVGSNITALSNGNYVVSSGSWNGNRGSATWCDGSTGFSGTVSSSNSLVGSNANDYVGNYGITVLSNGNYVVRSASWNGNRGAATWGNGSTGISGTVSSSNSLVGSNVDDYIGNYGITVLSNGNYVVRSSSWNGNRGAATWGNGSTGISGTVSSSNSLVGSNANDYIGGWGITVLSNGNYVVSSGNWNGNRGAATWCDGSTGFSGTVSSSNSLVGSNANDYVASMTALSNGNYVVSSTNWNSNRGSATWGNGSTGISGTVSSSNSLVGSNANDYVGSGITVLSNGNYVVRSGNWNVNLGAVTWGNGSTGISGTVSSSNSLVGSNANDYVGNYGITVLSNGNYVVRSGSWNSNTGAVSVSCNANPITGTVSALNSLLGATTSVGLGQFAVVHNTVYNYVLISSRNENKVYIHRCPQPEINVKGNGVGIVNGDITPSLADSTDMGATTSNLVRRFRIVNSGTDTLKISNIVSSGTHASNFVISNIPNNISAGDSSLFTVTFSSSTVGIKNASIKIFSNDVIQDTFQFAVRAEKLTNTKITNVDISENISVYPNPFNSFLNIDIESLLDGETAEIIIYDALGKMVFKQSAEQIANQLDLSNLTSGMYQFTIKTNNEIKHFKVIKQ
ncbi:MAG: choice-of-anchor D domain-containing protein [Bacteroidota bacterium]|nr:choice-of-anchor D domain-containing protein [Bacteroidota bacterium]